MCAHVFRAATTLLTVHIYVLKNMCFWFGGLGGLLYFLLALAKGRANFTALLLSADTESQGSLNKIITLLSQCDGAT